MAKKMATVTLLAVVVVAVLLAETPTTKAANCNALELSPCGPAVMSNQPPTSECCAKLQEQKPCLCGYTKDPSLKTYVNSPGAKRMASACKVDISC